MFGSVTELSLPLATGRIVPVAPGQGAARKLFWNGCMSISFLSSSPALTKPGELKEPSSPAFAIASLPATRSDRFAHQNMPGHLSFSPTAIGVMPASLSFWTSERNSLHVFGGASMPAFWKSALLYQTRSEEHTSELQSRVD